METAIEGGRNPERRGGNWDRRGQESGEKGMGTSKVGGGNWDRRGRN